jgi:hypothetical protein
VRRLVAGANLTVAAVVDGVSLLREQVGERYMSPRVATVASALRRLAQDRKLRLGDHALVRVRAEQLRLVLVGPAIEGVNLSLDLDRLCAVRTT